MRTLMVFGAAWLVAGAASGQLTQERLNAAAYGQAMINAANAPRPSAALLAAQRYSAQRSELIRVSHGHLTREVEGEVSSVLDPGWYHFCGSVVQAQDGGARISGRYECLGGTNAEAGEFFVAHLWGSFEGLMVAPTNWCMARDVGTYTYPTAGGSHRTLRKFDVGRMVDVVPVGPRRLSAGELAAMGERRAKMAEATFNYHKGKAEAGDKDSQFRLGELYRDGQGCEVSPAKAREWFAKAAAQGSGEAQEALKHLP